MVKMNQIGDESLRLMSFGGGVVVESYKHNQNNEFGVMEEYTLQHSLKEKWLVIQVDQERLLGGSQVCTEFVKDQLQELVWKAL